MKKVMLLASMLVVVMMVASPAMAQTQGQSSAAFAENAPSPPAYEVQPNGDVIIGGDVSIVDGCSMPAVLGDTPLSQDQLQQVLAQCEELGFSTQPTTAPDGGGMTNLPDTGGPTFLLPIVGLSLAGLGGLLLKRRLS